MALTFAEIVTYTYISTNSLITLIVSIIGVKYVQREFALQKKKRDDSSRATTIDIDGQSIDEEKHELSHDKLNELSKKGFVKLWFKIVWKMRSVYTCLAVHTFDVLTDVLIIMEWWYLEKKQGNIEHINPRLMAICGIATLIFHKMVSVTAFWLKEKNVYRCILQLLDVLIFEEIYISHKKIVAKFKNQKASLKGTTAEEEGIETTTSFKYVRSLEAVFESIPQSVLQTVFILRTVGQYETGVLVISLLSIFQSIVSMTNSIVKNDNIYMNTPKWKKHKQRLPPTIKFLKHAFCRLSEVLYRIALLSLFWTVCGGKAFSVILGTELFCVFALTVLEKRLRLMRQESVTSLSVEDMFLRVQMLVVLPSEMVFAAPVTIDEIRNTTTGLLLACCWTFCFCYLPVVCMSAGIRCYSKSYAHPDFRVGSSLIEWIIVISFGLFTDGKSYLFLSNYGLTVFIMGITSFLIYTQYLSLFPNFALPHDVNIRSQYGYALNGELEELQRMKMNFKLKTFSIKVLSEFKPSLIPTAVKEWNFPRLLELSNVSLLKTHFKQEISEIFHICEFSDDEKAIFLRVFHKLIDLEGIEIDSLHLEAFTYKYIDEMYFHFVETWIDEFYTTAIPATELYLMEVFMAEKQLVNKEIKIAKLQKFVGAVWPVMEVIEVAELFRAKVSQRVAAQIKDFVKRSMVKSAVTVDFLSFKYTTDNLISMEFNHALSNDTFNIGALMHQVQHDLDEEYGPKFHIVIESPWDKSAGYDEGLTCAMFAMANGHSHVVKWLEEEQFTRAHKGLFEEEIVKKVEEGTMSLEQAARNFIDPENDYF
eukprot:408789_1